MGSQNRTQGSVPTVSGQKRTKADKSGQKRTTENLFSSSQPSRFPQPGGFFIDPDQVSVYHDAGVCRPGVVKLLSLRSPGPHFYAHQKADLNPAILLPAKIKFKTAAELLTPAPE